MIDPKVIEHEAEIAVLYEKVDRLEATVDNMDKKLDELLSYVSMGRGIGWFLIKLGAAFVAVVGIAVTVYNFVKAW